MLVYANHIPLRTSRGLVEPLEPVADWLARKLRRKGSAEALLAGLELRTKDGWQLRSLVATDAYPHLASVELVHPDATVSGRRWHSEIGLLQQAAGGDVELSVLVHTSEVSARVVAPVSPGAPTFVNALLTRCRLSSAAIGGETRMLDDGDSEAFRYVVLDPNREHPFVVVSPTRDGSYLVDVKLLSQLLIGIAELVVIPPSADTFWLARGVGEEYVPYRGAVKIVYPFRSSGRGDVRTLTADELAVGGDDPTEAARELFSLVLHRTNVPLSWRHVTPARVREERLRRELEKKRLQASATGDAAEYTRFLEEYVREQEAATRAALDAKKVLEESLDKAQRAAEQVKRDSDAKVEALRYQLDQQAAAKDDSPYAPEDVEAVAAAVAAAIKSAPTPGQCLILIEHFYPTRVKILPEAWTSARESSAFKHGEKLFSLLHSLATGYWTDLCAGKPDQVARKIFGAAYAAKESEGVSGNKGAKKKRTFTVDGQECMMEKHLKIGNKDSAAETIRVHFEWFAERKRIVIGHCGPHIPFS